MSEDILKSVIEYAKKEIQLRIERESKKIVGEVITDVMARLKVDVYHLPERLTTEVRFVFNDSTN